MPQPSRRQALTLLAAGALTPCLPTFAAPGAPARLAPQDDVFLDDLTRRGCLFFLEQAHPENGQVLDRARYDLAPGQRDPRKNASIAATGFGLSALCIAHRRTYFDRGVIQDRIRRTLAFHLDHLTHDHGFLIHFNDIDTGAPLPWSEVSSIDTALFLCGVLTARACFPADPEIQRTATALYHRVDWPWMMDSGPLFHMGYNPGKGFIPATWNHYCELMMIPLLAMGSPTHPVPPATWSAWSRPTVTFDGLTYISGDDPLFTHQYSHAWFDFRGKRDAYADYFTNSILATRAHKAFCLSLGAPYSDRFWGISASDSEAGYQAWGGPAANGKPIGKLDGSVVPCAAAGSLPFLPADCLAVLRALKQDFPGSYTRYGFVDAFHPAAFHPATAWYDLDVLGIDLGIGVLMAENLRTGLIWHLFSQNPEVPRAMRLAGFHPAGTV